jgi:hypothetical protein
LASLNWFEDRVEFSEKETLFSLKGRPLDRLPEEMASKIKSLQINESHNLLYSNLPIII